MCNLARAVGIDLLCLDCQYISFSKSNLPMHAKGRYYCLNNAETPDTVGKISLQVLLPLLIFTFGPVSGAHFNPMVTAAFVASKAMVSCCTPCLYKSAMLAATFLLLIQEYAPQRQGDSG